MFNLLSAALPLLPRRLLASSPGTLTGVCRRLCRMEPAVVRCLPGEPKLTISFCLDGSHKQMLRDQDETLGKVLARISNGIAKGQGKAKKSKKNKGQKPGETPEQVIVKLFYEGQEVAETVLNSEAWQNGAVLHVGGCKYAIQRNAPTFTTAELPVSLLAGFPVCPNLEVEFGNLQDCEFTWFKENAPFTSPEAASEVPGEDSGWTEVGRGRVHVPSNQDIGYRLKLRCTPKDGGRSGVAKELVSVGAVEAGPGVCTFDNRHAYTVKEAEWPAVRVVSYNILADVYAQTELSKTVLYPYCAPYALQLDYRQNLIKKELAGYNADIVCLQEVDKAVFVDSLTPALDAFGLDGVFRIKEKQHEGLATFYRRSKFQLLSRHDIVLNEALTSDPIHATLLERVSANGALKDKILQRSTTLQIVQENYKGLSKSLTHLETSRDGTVTVEELLRLLQTYSYSVRREQLVNYLRRLEVPMDDNGERLSYMDFLSEFDPKAEKRSERPPSSPVAACRIESLDSLSPGLALTRMQELVTASAPNLYKAFLAFDQCGTGTVKALEFRQVLENLCARLSDKQYRYMLTKLQLDQENCSVNWKDFLIKFQPQSPLTETSEDTEPLQQIQEVVSGDLYAIAKELMDLDSSNSTTISKGQFRQLCDHHCLRLTKDQFECVWSQMPVNEQKKLQYREFLKRFGAPSRTEAGGPTNSVPSPFSEPRQTASATTFRPETVGAILQRTKSAPQCTSRRPASVGRPGTGSSLGSAERRLRGAMQRCWREILENCAVVDSQQEGHISTTSFLEILQSLGISMTQEQFEHLAVKFDISKNGCVSYDNFLRHFLLNLKPAEAKAAYERRRLPLPITPASHGVLSKDGVEVMLRIHGAVHSSWTSIRRCFLTCDHSRTGSVSVQDFRKVLRHFSVRLSEEEFFHLSSYFDANTTGRICYNDFLWAFLR